VNLFFLFTCILSILLVSSLVIPVDAQSSHPNLIVSAENDVGSTMTGFQERMVMNQYLELTLVVLMALQ
jgi:hypothetical protein